MHLLILLRSAGRGTNGGNGGNGGNIFTTVHDDELDLLLAVECNVKGGTQGRAAKHGVPGKGGRGGAGGSGTFYRCIYKDLKYCLPIKLTYSQRFG